MSSSSARLWRHRVAYLLPTALWLTWMIYRMATGHSNSYITTLLWVGVGCTVMMMITSKGESSRILIGDKFLSRFRIFVELPVTVAFVVTTPSYWWILLLLLLASALVPLSSQLAVRVEQQKRQAEHLARDEPRESDGLPVPVGLLDLLVYVVVALLTGKYAIKQLFKLNPA